MRLLLLIVYAALPHILSADCGCDGLTKAQKRQWLEDDRSHGCRSCKGITASMDDCPPLNYECNEDWTMSTNVLSQGDCACSEIRCVGKSTRLAVNGTIENKVRCSRGQWTAGKNATASAVCAKFCGLDVCKASSPKYNSALYVPLTIAAPSGDNKCTTGSCANGAVVINADSTLNKTLNGVATVTCTGDGLWNDGEERHQFVMCNVGPPACETACDFTPLPTTIFNPNNNTAAIRTGCSFSCGANEALLRLDTTDPIDAIPITISSATCEDSGQYRVNTTLTVDRIGCYKCDLPDGDYAQTHASSPVKIEIKSCIATCPNGYQLEYWFMGPRIPVNRLVRRLYGPSGDWYDEERGEVVILPFFGCTSKV